MTTALLIKEHGVEKRLLFMTVPTVGAIHVDLFLANENFEPIGQTSIGESPTITDEVEYHTRLRAEASERGQFVPECSTNPELNPGYVEYVEETDIDSDQS